MNVIFSDSDILIVNKPYGLLSQGSQSGGDNIISLLKSENGETVLPVHRLDRTTGGLMVFAKNKRSAAKLSEQILNKRFKKTYLAVCPDKINPEKGEMRDILFFDRIKNKSFVVKKERKGAKSAELSYEKLSEGNFGKEKTALFKIELKTGRTHQIRVQFASRGAPLIGDRRYGSDIKSKNIALWSYALNFLHPATGKEMKFSLLPKDDIFINLLSQVNNKV